MENKKHQFILGGTLVLSFVAIIFCDGVSLFLLGVPAFTLFISACTRTFKGEKCESDFSLAGVLLGLAVVSLSIHFTLYHQNLTDAGKNFVSIFCATGISLSVLSALLYHTHYLDVRSVEKNEACAER